MNCYAHTHPDYPHDPKKWQLLEKHLKAVAEMAADFAKPFGGQEWAYVAGLWHDLGKYSDAFQDYLRSGSEASAESQPGKIDHSTVGAQQAAEVIPVAGILIAFAIAGHHAGVSDAFAEGSCLEKRLKKVLPNSWRNGLSRLPPPEVPGRLPLPSDAFAVAFFTRMLFSSLTDADFLDTEAFMRGSDVRYRGLFPDIRTLHDRFFQQDEHHDTTLSINAIRADIRFECERAADLPPGFFSLTVPTGGGKTLSSLAFALKHACRHDLRRVLYVAPFTSIIEQNADVFRKRLGDDALIEHHCNLDPERETKSARLASENWDAPLIVTTSVQFYDSLFANRPSSCRKLHNIARSVIILDEAQTLPVEYLKPCLAALKELVARYGCSVVLCTATQPAINERPDFDIGLSGVREIMTDPQSLYGKLKRVQVRDRGAMSDSELTAEVLCRKQALCVVNTTGHARELFCRLGEDDSHYHLSARMCPAHRAQTLLEIRARLDARQTCRVISTQVVEAGVDLDFPVVYRALAGLDSITQAAGRCNRNGRLPDAEVYVFRSEHVRSEAYFRETAQCAAQVMALHPDTLSLEANEQFFRLYYWSRQAAWDKKHIFEKFRFSRDLNLPFDFAFATAAHDFHLIDEEGTCSVIIPWSENGISLAARLRSEYENPTRSLLRLLQRFIVSVRKNVWDRHAGRSIKPVFDTLGILESPETHYDNNTGLNLDAEGPGIYVT